MPILQNSMSLILPKSWLWFFGLLFCLLSAGVEAQSERQQSLDRLSGYKYVNTSFFEVVLAPGMNSPKESFNKIIDDTLVDVRSWLGSPSTRKPQIYLVHGRSGFNSLLAELGIGEKPDWVPALALPGSGVIVFDMEYSRRNPAEGISTLKHEIVHVVLAESGGALPRWVHEGIAQSLARQSPGPQKKREVAVHAYFGELVPINEMDQYLPISHQRATTLYAVSVMFIDWTRFRYGEGFHASVLRQCKAGMSWDQAFFEESGETLDSAFELWQNSLKAGSVLPGLIPDLLISWKTIAVMVVIAALVQQKRRRRALEAMKQAELEEEEQQSWNSQQSPTSDGQNTRD
ncbi:MAG: hypothetical protein GWP35_04215 [Proteobacteria bacterium]|nr:hypothetical protein [Pseudomonadota bacterium]